MNNRPIYFYGLIGGIGLGWILNSLLPPRVNSVEILPIPSQPIIKLNQVGTDGFYIRSPTDSTRYIRIVDYLKNNFPNVNERNLERARIDSLVSRQKD